MIDPSTGKEETLNEFLAREARSLFLKEFERAIPERRRVIRSRLDNVFNPYYRKDGDEFIISVPEMAKVENFIADIIERSEK